MTKEEFIQKYRSPEHLLITIHFSNIEFRKEDDLSLQLREITTSELDNFFVLRARKNGMFDDRGFEVRENDPDSELITARVARNNPLKWNLDLGDRRMPSKDILWPVPIATNSLTNRSLVLDSNHLIANLPPSWRRIKVAEIKGSNLEAIIGDFKILNRQ